MSRYAKDTEVPEEGSRAEIEKTLGRYGASGFMYAWQGDRAVVAFEAHGRRIRFDVPMPSAEDPEVPRRPPARSGRRPRPRRRSRRSAGGGGGPSHWW